MTPALTCAACRALLPEYVAQTLAPKMTAQVEAHLASCAACREELATTQDLVALIHQPFPGDTPPPDSLTRVMTQVRLQLAEQFSANHQSPPGAHHRISATRPAVERAMPPPSRPRRVLIFPLVVVALIAVLATIVFTRPHSPSSIAAQFAPLTTAQLHGMDLRAVAFATPDEGWAVGSTIPASQPATPATRQPAPYVSPVLLHELGGRWSVAALPPSISQTSFVLTDIRVVSPREGWAIARVQYPPNADGLVVSELLHEQNGQWIVASPQIPADLTQLAFANPSDGWAVGTSTGGGNEAFVLHYDGTSWNQVHNPAFTALSLSAVAVDDAHTLWAAGISTQSVGPDGAAPTVLLAFDGTRWTRHALPTTDATARITALALPSATDGWAVGVLTSPASPSGAGNPLIPDQALIFRFHQGAWSEVGRVAGPSGVTAYRFFSWYGISLSSPTDGWIVGSAGTMAHLTANGPHLVTPSPQSQDVLGVAMLSPSDGWAVGVRGTILHLSQGTWQLYQP